MSVLEINLDSWPLSDEQFYQLCLNNRDLRFERNAIGNLIIMPPTGGKTGNRNIEISYQLQSWSRQTRFGIAFDSSTGFKLPNGADRSPDASWVAIERWNRLSEEELLSSSGADLIPRIKTLDFKSSGISFST